MDRRRRRRFVPTMDHLGFRITPSDLTPVAAVAAPPDDECYIPGEHSEVTPSLTWDTPSGISTPLIGCDDPIEVTNIMAIN